MKPEITSLAEFFDRPERMTESDQALMIDVFVDHWMQPTQIHNCKFCKADMVIRKGDKHHCPTGLDSGTLTCVEWL